MRSLLFELYKNIDVPSASKYELVLSSDETSVFTNDDLRNADWDIRQKAIKASTKKSLINNFGLTSAEIQAMQEQSVLYKISEEWLNDPTAYKCSQYLSKGENLETKVQIAQSNAAIAKAAWKRILQSKNPRIKKVDRVEGSWFDPTVKQYSWSSDMGISINKWGQGYKLVGADPDSDQNSRIIVDTENKTIDFGAFERVYSNRRPRQFSGKKGTLTIPSGGAGLRGEQQNMKKIMGFLIKNDPRVDKTYRIQGVLEWTNLTLDDVMYDKEKGRKGVQPVNQRVVQDMQGMNTGGSYLFHGTSEFRWNEIQRLGYMRGGAPSREGYQYVDLKPGWSEGNIYLTDTAEDAENYASRQFDKDGTKAVVLRVKVPDPSKLVIDEDNKHMLDSIKFANMVRDAGIPYSFETSGNNKEKLDPINIPEESDPEFQKFASNITYKFSKEDYIEDALRRTGLRDLREPKHLTAKWLENNIMYELGWSSPEGKKFQDVLMYDRKKEWKNQDPQAEISKFLEIAKEEGFGEIVQAWIDKYPKYDPRIVSKESFIEYLTPLAEKWEEIARTIWLDKQAAIEGFKRAGTIAYQGEIPAKNIEVVMVYKPKTMKDDPDENEYNKAMDATRDTVINRYSLEQQWKDMKAADPKAKPTKDMKAWEKSYGYKFERKYSLRSRLL